MIKTAILFTVMLALFTSGAHAQTAGVNLSWDDCGDWGVLNKTFACNSNSGTNAAVGSFVAPDGIAQLTGTEMILDVVAQGDSLPPWWAFKNAGACRQGALRVNFIYTGSSCDLFRPAFVRERPAGGQSSTDPLTRGRSGRLG